MNIARRMLRQRKKKQANFKLERIKSISTIEPSLVDFLNELLFYISYLEHDYEELRHKFDKITNSKEVKK